MELIYFISGILSVGVVYGIILLRAVKSSHTDLLARHQSQSNISSIRDIESKEELEALRILIGDIQANMEKDQYENLGKLSQRIQELDTVSYENVNKIKLSSESNDKNFSRVFSEIQQLKNSYKTMLQDPNFLNRY